MSARHLGLIANRTKAGARELCRDLLREFARHEWTTEVDTGTAELLGNCAGLPVQELAEKSEMLVVLGGDGTILQVLHEIGDKCPPLFGINIGSLGFLTSVSAGQWLRAVDCIVSGKYLLSERRLLSVEVLRKGEVISRRHALNDAVISRGELSRLIRLDVRIDGELLSEYNADGLIIATPTGSTAYSLSAGGPVITPTSGVFVVTPICPHVLTMRPVMVSDSSVIEIAHSTEPSDIFLTIDGQKALRIEAGESLRIVRAAVTLSLAMLPGMSFFEVLRQKLKWGGSAV